MFHLLLYCQAVKADARAPACEPVRADALHDSEILLCRYPGPAEGLDEYIDCNFRACGAQDRSTAGLVPHAGHGRDDTSHQSLCDGISAPECCCSCRIQRLGLQACTTLVSYQPFAKGVSARSCHTSPYSWRCMPQEWISRAARWISLDSLVHAAC